MTLMLPMPDGGLDLSFNLRIILGGGKWNERN